MTNGVTQNALHLGYVMNGVTQNALHLGYVMNGVTRNALHLDYQGCSISYINLLNEIKMICYNLFNMYSQV